MRYQAAQSGISAFEGKGSPGFWGGRRRGAAAFELVRPACTPQWVSKWVEP